MATRRSAWALVLCAAAGRASVAKTPWGPPHGIRAEHDYNFVWVHTPKTGSTMCLSLNHAQCPKAFEAAEKALTMYRGCISLKRATCFAKAGHDPVGSHYLGSWAPPSRRYVIMLREPTSRIVSSYMDSQHHEGMSESRFKSIKAESARFARYAESQPGMTMAAFLDLQHRARRLAADAAPRLGYGAWERAYLETNDWKGCVVKSITGRWCSQNATLTNKDVDDAWSRLKKFAFVGYTAQWNATVDAFLGGLGLTPDPVEYQPNRVQTSHKGGIEALARRFYRDPWDAELFRRARAAWPAPRWLKAP